MFFLVEMLVQNFELIWIFHVVCKILDEKVSIQSNIDVLNTYMTRQFVHTKTTRLKFEIHK